MDGKKQDKSQTQIANRNVVIPHEVCLMFEVKNVRGGGRIVGGVGVQLNDSVELSKIGSFAVSVGLCK